MALLGERYASWLRRVDLFGESFLCFNLGGLGLFSWLVRGLGGVGRCFLRLPFTVCISLV